MYPDTTYTDYVTTTLVISVILWTVVGAAVTPFIYAAKKRPRSTGVWVGALVGFFGGIFLGVFPLIILWVALWFLLPKLDKICPNCGRANASNATVCKYCNHVFAPVAAGVAQPSAQYIPPQPAPVDTSAPVMPSPAQNQAVASKQSAPSKNSIFVPYRRDDSADVTGRIYDKLVERFGKDAIFKDVDSIPFGVDFRTYLKNVVGSCGVLIAIIGDHWLTITDQDGHRRLDDPADYVRIEVESALQRDVPVIPLLVKGARMPKDAELPVELKDLAFRNGTMVRNDPDFHPDMDRLIKNLEQQIK